MRLLLMAVLLAGCTVAPEPTAQPTIEPTPTPEGAIEIHTQCGLRLPVLMDGDWWFFTGKQGHNAPDGFDSPRDVGTVELVNEDTAVYTSSHGVKRELQRWEGPLPSLIPCL